MKKIKKQIMIVICGGLLFLLTGCGAQAAQFNGVSENRGGFDNTTIAPLVEEDYWAFIHRRFILVYDDAGVLQYVKINNEVGRHNYDLEALTADERGYIQYAPEGQVVSRVGIDVSKHQGTIDWAKVKAAGIDYAMIRIGYRGYGNGAIVLDETFKQNINGAINAGIPVGVYFYSQAISYEEGVEEANFVLENLAGYDISYPVVLDTEDAENDGARTNNISVDTRTDACIGFCETIKAAGYEPMIYANKKWFALDLDVSRLSDYDWWYAQYANEPDFPYEFTMWQYTNAGTVDGINGSVDLNIEFYNYD